jgi:hypothetical protein
MPFVEKESKKGEGVRKERLTDLQKADGERLRSVPATSLYRHSVEAWSGTSWPFPVPILATCRNDNNSCLGALSQANNNKY